MNEGPKPGERSLREPRGLHGQIEQIFRLCGVEPDPYEGVFVTKGGKSHVAIDVAIDMIPGRPPFPTDFVVPAFYIHFTDIVPFREWRPVNTPYGRQPQVAVSNDNHVYFFSTFYFMNRDQFIKFEEIEEVGDEEMKIWHNDDPYGLLEKHYQIERSEVESLDFIPDMSDSRFTIADPGDHEKVATLIRGIQRGELTVVSRRSMHPESSQ